MSPEVVQSQVNRKITYKQLDQLPEAGLNGLEPGRYELHFPQGTRRYTVSLFINSEVQTRQDTLPLVVRGGLNDSRKVYQDLCEALSQARPVIYIEQTNRPLRSNQSTKSKASELDAEDICTIVNTKLGIKKANMLSHSLTTLEAGFAGLAARPDGEKGSLFNTIILAAPVGLEPGSLSAPFTQNLGKVSTLATQKRRQDRGEDPQRARAVLSEYIFPRSLLRRLTQKAQHRKEAEEGLLGSHLLPRLAGKSDIQVILLLPREDFYSKYLDLTHLSKQMDTITLGRDGPPNVHLLAPMATTLVSNDPIEVLSHGFVSLGRPSIIANIMESVLDLVEDMKNSYVEVSHDTSETA